MTIPAEMICYECGEGHLEPRRRAGRFVTHAGARLEVPAELPIPTCTHCDAEWYDAQTTAAIDAAASEVAHPTPRVEWGSAIQSCTLANFSAAGSPRGSRWHVHFAKVVMASIDEALFASNRPIELGAISACRFVVGSHEVIDAPAFEQPNPQGAHSNRRVSNRAAS